MDRADHRGGPDRFSHLLPAELGFRDLPFDEKRKRDTSYCGRSEWGVFANPAVVGRADYDAVSTCLASNLLAIDGAFAFREGEESLSAWPVRRPQLTSIVHAAYDPEFTRCGPKTIGLRWACGAGEGYIKTRVGDSEPFILCTREPRRERNLLGKMATWDSDGMVVGSTSIDRAAVFVGKPDAGSYEYRTLLAGKVPKAYYATCKDVSGRGFFETLQPLDPHLAGESSPSSTAMP